MVKAMRLIDGWVDETVQTAELNKFSSFQTPMLPECQSHSPSANYSVAESACIQEQMEVSSELKNP
jgi:hypothetical protein